MTRLSGKIVETRGAEIGESELALGKRLRGLRTFAELTQADLAKRLGISQAALSKLEGRTDIHVSKVREYVEALGAQLHIGATFSSASEIGFRVLSAFDAEALDENQLVLPIYGDDAFRKHRDVVLSIKPQYSSKILTGEKTVELRRRFPLKVPKGTLAFIYSTTPDKALVGCAEIAAVTKERVPTIWRNLRDEACIEKADFDAYFDNQDHGFVLRFSKAKAFQNSIDLNELRSRFDFEAPQSFLYAKPLLREALRHELSELSDRY
ncbi:helix-turn-helix domain-containing protein [Qipengyuania flava]|uniref:helix-turn-helix domain-containing protein n=1 Tax=Qipengyuania flava TaxID=192812 RepID=UPI001ADC4265|nr:helix-turn-helix domain-containing protein [Qipengyuania flava]MBO9505384.1 helix-turn-helix domain-containing protein [Qipengyuania flava]